jgi:hypothetical protein
MQKPFRNFLRSVVVFPALTASLALSPISGIAKSPTVAVIFPVQTRTLSSEEVANQQLITKEAAQVDKYLLERGSPLAGYGRKFVEAADRNGLPHFSIVALTVIESGATVHCKNDPYNYMGWDSCNGNKFESQNDAIDTVADTLGAHSDNPKMVRAYQGKSFEKILGTYNGYVNTRYIPNIKIVMEKIANIDVDESVANADKPQA